MKYVKLFDIIAIILVLVLAIASAVPMLARGDGSGFIVTAGDDVTRIPASDGLYTVESDGHTLTVRVEDGAAKVIAADCPDGLCMRMPAISGVGSIVCVPARVVIRAAEMPEGEVDGVAG